MRKKILGCIAIVFILIFSSCQTKQALSENEKNDKDIYDNSVILFVGNAFAYVNNNKTPIEKDNPALTPFIENGRTFVPLKFISEAFHASVDWRQETLTAVIQKDDITLSVVLNDTKLLKTQNNDSKTIPMDTAAKSMDGRLFIPVTYISDALGKEVLYDRGLIIISDEKVTLDKAALDAIIAKVNSLPTLDSEENLEKIIGTPQKDFAGSMREGEMMEAQFESAMSNDVSYAPAPSVPESAVKAESDYSATNIQVAGVDEADIIKTDGEYIYYISGTSLRVVKAVPADDMKLIQKIDFENAVSPSEVYLEKEQLIIIADSTGYTRPSGGLVEEVAYDRAASPSTQNTSALFFDIKDKNNITQSREITLKGSYFNSRKIGGALYFIAVADFYTLQEGGALRLPQYKDSASGNEFINIPYTDIYYFPGSSVHRQYTIVAGVNLNRPELPAYIYTYYGAGQNLYVSGENMYIAAANYHDSSTDIYKFSLEQGKTTYLFKGNVPGQLLNQFSMDESGDYFRVATTGGFYRFNQYYTGNNLFVLDESMKIVGKIENIALNENIYSVRFMGNKAYMVTFRQVDPLFAIDLKDPYHPKVMGKLKIPGYSSYLHPYDENHLIGFGKDADEETGELKGMKIALFDVTDMENPKEMYVELIGGSGTESELLYDHKALLFSREKNLLAFPVMVMDFPNRELTFQGAYVYDITLEKGLQPKGKITHISDAGFSSSEFVDRIIYIGNNLYTLSDMRIKANDINNLQETGSLKINE